MVVIGPEVIVIVGVIVMIKGDVSREGVDVEMYNDKR